MYTILSVLFSTDSASNLFNLHFFLFLCFCVFVYHTFVLFFIFLPFFRFIRTESFFGGSDAFEEKLGGGEGNQHRAG